MLLVSTYELGHQPLHLAAPAAALRAAGHDARCLDVSVDDWEDGLVTWADAVGFSVPMHTAMRLAVPLAGRARALRPDLPIALYGLYAPVSRDLTVGRVADRAIAGEYEPALVAWVDGLATGAPPSTGDPVTVHLDRPDPPLPARELLPPLDRYAHLALGGDERPVGYVEATHGCLHRCRHCPVPTVYGGRFRAVPRTRVLDDVEQLVGMGARHVTFGDPDFLNAPTHALRLVTEMHERWPWLTFDVTAKVDHVLERGELWERFAEAGCLFVVSAFETVNDDVLARLDKGHTAAQEARVVRLLRSHGIEVRPSWLPFTPWTTAEDLLGMLDFVAEHDLIGNVDPVQYTIRLLLPEGSLLLDEPELRPFLGPYDAEGLTYTWRSADPRMDRLQGDLALLVAERIAGGERPEGIALDVAEAVARSTGAGRPIAIPAGSTTGRPRLTEPWFC